MEHERGEACAGSADVARKAHRKVLTGPDIRLGPYRDHVREMTRSLLDLLEAGKDCVHEGFTPCRHDGHILSGSTIPQLGWA